MILFDLYDMGSSLDYLVKYTCLNWKTKKYINNFIFQKEVLSFYLNGTYKSNSSNKG